MGHAHVLSSMMIYPGAFLASIMIRSLLLRSICGNCHHFLVLLVINIHKCQYCLDIRSPEPERKHKAGLYLSECDIYCLSLSLQISMNVPMSYTTVQIWRIRLVAIQMEVLSVFVILAMKDMMSVLVC